MAASEYPTYETTMSTLRVSEAAATTECEGESVLHKSQRTRTLTQKGKGYITDTFFKCLVPFDKTLDKVNSALNDYVPELKLMENAISIEKEFQRLVGLYDSLRDEHESEPGKEIVRAMDRLEAKKEETMTRIKRRMAAHASGSVKSVKSLKDQLSIGDEGSSVKSKSSTSSKIRKSQAMLAAHAAELKAAKEMADAEIKKRKRVLEQQAIQRKLEAESAKVEAYREIEKSEKGSPVNGSEKNQSSSDMQALAYRVGKFLPKVV